MDSYHSCIADLERTSIIAYVSLSLTFGEHSITLHNPPPFLELNHSQNPVDIAVFTSVIVQVRLIKSIHPGMGVSSILNTISKDAKIFFAVIASSHILVVIMYSVARVGFFIDSRVQRVLTIEPLPSQCCGSRQ